MNNLRIVLLELFERKTQLLTSFIAITLGITVIVSIQTITHFSKFAISQELDNLGANILIMPKESNIDNYYRSDFVDAYLPESYIGDITTSNLAGVENLSPRLVIPNIKVGDKSIHLTGVLPLSDFPKKPTWADKGKLFSKPSACGPSYTANATVAENAVRRKIIQNLGHDECFVGSQVANDLDIKVGSTTKIKENTFKVIEVLPETGTVDDTRILVHLHVAQKMFNIDSVINVIEVVG